jgi:two-component system sensor histidine kinase KdpD
VAVREVVPDSLLDEADEVELVDLPPDDLLQRLREGRVYVPEQAQRAVTSFFRKGNLIALRELALRRTADRVDEDVRDYRRVHEIEKTWPVAERILVCLRPNPESVRLVQSGRRLASRLRAEWIVAYVESPFQAALSEAERQALAAAFKLAEDLGADTAVLRGESVSEALLAYARAHNVSKIVVGKPARPRWRDRVFGSPVDAVVRNSGDIDVYVISGAEAPPLEHAPRERPPGRRLAGHAWSVSVVILCTLLCWAMFPQFDRSNLIMVYLLGVAFVATRFGRWPAVSAACLSVAAFDFFFVPPYLTFAVRDTQYVVTFAVMLLVALLVSTLGVRAVEQAEAAHQRGRRTQLLYTTSRELSALTAPGEIAQAGVRHVAEALRGPALVLLPGPDGGLVAASADTLGVDADVRERAVAEWVFKHGRRAGLGTDTLPAAGSLYVPLPGSHAPVGVLAVRPHDDLLPLSPGHLGLLETLARLIAAPIERARLSAEKEAARLEMESERLRSTLLSCVSHDLRTPLGAITGAATMLLDESLALTAARRVDLARAIYEEADRLNRLVTNLLAMTRLESGDLRVTKEWVPLEEVVGSALDRFRAEPEDRRVSTVLADDLPLVPMDPLLLEQVFVNLIENALRYAPPGAPVELSARREGDAVAVEIADRGPGLPQGSEARVFDKFFRAGARRGGTGLGLAICRGIVSAHGGTIKAANRPGGGALFTFSLPLEGPPPPVPEEAH